MRCFFVLSIKNKNFYATTFLFVPFLIISCFCEIRSFQTTDDILHILSQEKYFPYQDIIINHQTIWRGLGPDCPSRYQAIKKKLASLYAGRPFSCIDIGADNGYFSMKLAEDFGSTAVMVDVSDRLANICKFNTAINDKLMYLKMAVSEHDLEKMVKKVHFDVAIVFNVLHHVEHWEKCLDYIFSLADTVIVETPPFNDPRVEQYNAIPDIEKRLQEQKGEVIASTLRVKPGAFDNLTKMKQGLVCNVSYLEGVASKMFVFAQKKSQAMHTVSIEQLKEFNIAFPKIVSLDKGKEL